MSSMLGLGNTVAKFEGGRLVATPGALRAIPNQKVWELLRRHFSGDWGDMSAEDKHSNDVALKRGDERIFSSYANPAEHCDKVWIITEADHSVTTVLLPDEY